MTLRDDYVVALEAENDALRARIAQLEETFGFRDEVPLDFGLTPQETKLVGILLKRDVVTKEQVTLALYGNRPDIDVEIKIVDVFICKVRAKLKPFDIAVETLWGRGYRLLPSEKAKIAALRVEGAAA